MRVRRLAGNGGTWMNGCAVNRWLYAWLTLGTALDPQPG